MLKYTLLDYRLQCALSHRCLLSVFACYMVASTVNTVLSIHNWLEKHVGKWLPFQTGSLSLYRYPILPSFVVIWGKPMLLFMILKNLLFIETLLHQKLGPGV